MQEIIIGLLIGLILLLVWFISLVRKKLESSNTNELLLLQNQLQELSRSVSNQLDQGSRAMQKSVFEQLSNSQKLIKDITQEISEVKETNKQIFNFTDALQNLEKTLKNQKQRGSLGEEGLKLILENMLGPVGELYELQYKFNNNEIVDAIIKAKDGFICIDAKFSLDNYQRLITATDDQDKIRLEKDFKNDLKKRIDETAKYIKNDEGTLSFALMYIPAEGIYYDLLVNQTGTGVNTRSLIEYANQKKVIIVSPMTLYAYLQTVLHGFNAFKIERQTENIQRNVSKLKDNLARFDEYHQKLGNSLGTVVNHYNASRKKFVQIDRNVLKITGENSDIESIEIEKPLLE